MRGSFGKVTPENSESFADYARKKILGFLQCPKKQNSVGNKCLRCFFMKKEMTFIRLLF